MPARPRRPRGRPVSPALSRRCKLELLMKWADNCKNDVNSPCDYDDCNCVSEDGRTDGRGRECANASKCERPRYGLTRSASAYAYDCGLPRQMERMGAAEKGADDSSQLHPHHTVVLARQAVEISMFCSLQIIFLNALSSDKPHCCYIPLDAGPKCF